MKGCMSTKDRVKTFQLFWHHLKKNKKKILVKLWSSKFASRKKFWKFQQQINQCWNFPLSHYTLFNDIFIHAYNLWSCRFVRHTQSSHRWLSFSSPRSHAHVKTPSPPRFSLIPIFPQNVKILERIEKRIFLLCTTLSSSFSVIFLALVHIFSAFFFRRTRDNRN